jgi:hypothetical protein
MCLLCCACLLCSVLAPPAHALPRLLHLSICFTCTHQPLTAAARFSPSPSTSRSWIAAVANAGGRAAGARENGDMARIIGHPTRRHNFPSLVIGLLKDLSPARNVPAAYSPCCPICAVLPFLREVQVRRLKQSWSCLVWFITGIGKFEDDAKRKRWTGAEGDR